MNLSKSFESFNILYQNAQIYTFEKKIWNLFKLDIIFENLSLEYLSEWFDFSKLILQFFFEIL